VYSNNHHTLDELKQSIHETITPIKASALTTSIKQSFRQSCTLFKSKMETLNIYCKSEFLKLFIYVQKCMQVFIMYSILTMPGMEKQRSSDVKTNYASFPKIITKDHHIQSDHQMPICPTG
jgi:c-di-AMP phosphodiesterase-like protein